MSADGAKAVDVQVFSEEVNGQTLNVTALAVHNTFQVYFFFHLEYLLVDFSILFVSSGQCSVRLNYVGSSL
jgi:hypothetical protein